MAAFHNVDKQQPSQTILACGRGSFLIVIVSHTASTKLVGFMLSCNNCFDIPLYYSAQRNQPIGGSLVTLYRPRLGALEPSLASRLGLHMLLKV